MFTIDWSVVNEIWRRSPISLEHVSLWCFLFDPHLTTYHSNIGIRLRSGTKKHMHTLCLHNFWWVFWMSRQIPMYFISPIFNAMLCMLGFQKLETGGGIPKDGVHTYCHCMVTLFTLKPLKDVGFQHTTKYTIYTVAIKFMNRIWHIYGFEVLFYMLSSCQKEDTNLLILDINDQNTMYVFVFKVTWVAHLIESPLTSR